MPPRAWLGRTTSLLLLLAVGCNGSSQTDRLGLPVHRPVTEQEVRRLAPSHLLYPGSHVVREIGADERRQPDEAEPDPAFAGSIAVSRATASALLDWYTRQLTSRGYQPATYYRLSDQTTGGAWTAPGGREQVQVGIYSPSSRAAGRVPADDIGYEQVLVNYRVTGPPPG